MELYRTIPCQHCGIDDGTVAGAHSNQAAHGKGKGIKASDEFAASLCAKCHKLIDSGNLTRDEATEIWQKAHEKTLELLVKTNELIKGVL